MIANEFSPANTDFPYFMFGRHGTYLGSKWWEKMNEPIIACNLAFCAFPQFPPN